jgi:hypothetical protein
MRHGPTPQETDDGAFDIGTPHHMGNLNQNVTPRRKNIQDCSVIREWIRGTRIAKRLIMYLILLRYFSFKE